MSENNSVYNRIKAAIGPDGVLPDDFVLRQLPDGGMRFADGAMDGTVRYHMGPTQNPDISGLTLVLEMASQERFKDAANALVTHFNQGGVMLPVIDALQDWVYDHPGSLSPEALGRFARTLLVQSGDPESVKFAITVLELLDQEPDQELRDILLTLAVSEELTLFCLFIIGTFEDGNQLIYSLARRLKGWGKIHAVSMLKPENDEMKEWLLREGWRNEIMPEYSAAAVIKRGKLIEFLQGDVSSDDFSLAGQLIGYSLADTPVPGLGKYKKTGELLRLYIDAAEKQSLELNDYNNLFDVRDFLKTHEVAEGQGLIGKCSKILESADCHEAIEQAMACGEGFYLAKALGMDYAKACFDALQRNWREQYDLVDLLLPERLYTDEIIQLFEEELPLEEMATGPENEMGNSPEFADYGVLSYVVQALQAAPGKGEQLICSALFAPVIGCRNIALNTVEKWRKSDFQITEAMADTLSRLKVTEVHPQTKKRLESF